MFGTTHILYLVISFALTGGIITLGKLFIKTDEGHNRLIKLFAILTVIIHMSPLWVDYLTTGRAEVEAPMIFAIYPCNICMWLLLLSSFIKREGILYRLLSEFTCLGGTVCGIIGLVFNENFGSNPTLLDYGVLKGMLSHSTMVLGCIYLGASGLVKIRLRNTLSVVAGLVWFIINGLAINGIYAHFGLDSPNSMYLQKPPFEALPWINTVVIGIAAVVVVIAFTTLFEKLVLKKKWKEIFTLSNLCGYEIGKK